MKQALLPSSAAAFAPRTPACVVLDGEVPEWLAATLKRVNPPRRRLNDPRQQTDYLAEILSSEKATWTLCSMIIFDTRMIHIEAYVVHVDMVSRNEVVFKLTEGTISVLENIHEECQLVDPATYTWPWPQRDSQIRDSQEEFVKAANKFVYRTDSQALEGLEEDGSGELLSDSAMDVKAAICRLFVPLVPPSRVVHFLCPVYPLSVGTRPRAHKFSHLLETSTCWSNPPVISFLNTRYHPDSIVGDRGYPSGATFSPIDCTSSQLLTTGLDSATYPSSPMAMYSSTAAADCMPFDGDPSLFC